MRSRTLSAAGAGAAALVLATVLAPGASAHVSPSGSHNSRLVGQTSAAPLKSAKICFKNMKLRHATGADIPSNTYDDVNSTADSQAADDFTLTQPCLAKEVDVTGTFDQESVVDWENIYIYPDAGGVPGSPAIWVQSSLNGKQGASEGSFNIKFGPLLLQPGTYWVSVQLQLKSGQWGWDNTTKAFGSPAVFQNPGGAFPGCPTWKAIQTCFPTTPGPDLMFAIKGDNGS